MIEPQQIYRCPVCRAAFDTLAECEEHCKAHEHLNKYHIVRLKMHDYGGWDIEKEDEWSEYDDGDAGMPLRREPSRCGILLEWYTRTREGEQPDEDECIKRLRDTAKRWLKDAIYALDKTMKRRGEDEDE